MGEDCITSALNSSFFFSLEIDSRHLTKWFSVCSTQTSFLLFLGFLLFESDDFTHLCPEWITLLLYSRISVSGPSRRLVNNILLQKKLVHCKYQFNQQDKRDVCTRKAKAFMIFICTMTPWRTSIWILSFLGVLRSSGFEKLLINTHFPSWASLYLSTTKKRSGNCCLV